MILSLSRPPFSARIRLPLTVLFVSVLLVTLVLSLPTGADAFMGGLFGKGQRKKSVDKKAQTEEVLPAAAFKPVPVQGDMPEKTEEAAPAAAPYGTSDPINSVLFPETPAEPAAQGIAPIFGYGSGENGFEETQETFTSDEADGTEPVLFFELEPVEEFEPAQPDLALDDLLMGASTDEALLRIARIYTAKGEVDKGIRAYSRLIEDFPASASRFDAFYELGYLRYRGNRLREARLLLEYVVKSRNAVITLKDSARTLLEEIDSIYERGAKKSQHVSIGALLPLGGKYTKMGNAALRGILLATGAFEDDGVAIDVYVRDTGGTKAGAKAAIEELVNVKKVRGMVGPMLSSTAKEAAQYSQNKQTPVVVLSQRDGLTEIGNFVFRNSLLPSSQAALVASYAYHTLGNRTFVILYPRSRYGATLARAFAVEVERLGGVIINKASYKPGSQDLNKELRDLFLIEEEETVKGRRVIKEYNPTVVADALYMPDYYQTISMIVPYLKYFNIDELQLLGSNGWNSKKLVAAGGKSIRGAVFTDGFFTGTKRAASVEFIKKYRAVYGSVPGVVESQAYDAALLLLDALSKNGYDWMDRASLRENLINARGVTGSIGSISVESGGEVDKNLFLLKIERGGIVEVEVDEAVRFNARHDRDDTGTAQQGGTVLNEEEELWD